MSIVSERLIVTVAIGGFSHTFLGSVRWSSSSGEFLEELIEFMPFIKPFSRK